MNSESCTFRWTITFFMFFEIFQGAWGGCGPVPRLEYASPEDSALNQNIFLPNATVAYNCRPGYRRIPGSRTLTCQEDYTWSTPVPFCTLKSCGNPGEIENGEMHAENFLFGSRVTYTCNEGYRMISKRNYRDCEADGTWSNAPPECEGGCGPVPRLEYASPEDSALNQNIFLPNATVAYNCRPGYRRIPGSRTLTCQEDYTWSTPVPFCTLKSCGNPGEIENGEMHAENFLFGSRVTYTCNEGYRMISKRNYRDCEADGTWSNAPPECEGGCGPVPRLEYASPEDSALNQNIFLPNATVAYNCRPGYRRIPGSRTLTCQEDYTWSTPVPFCTLKSCGNPGEIENGEMHAENFFFGSRVTYTCNEGYRMISKRNYRDCEADGTWSNAPPECEGGCGPVPRLEYASPEDSALNQNIFLPNATVAYNCRPGYRRIPGSRTLTCQEDYTWSTPVPFCTLKSCGNPGEIENGEMHAENFLFGSRVTYTCNEGYRMISKRNYRDCEADGTWSNAPPECEGGCGPVPRLEYASPDDSALNQNIFLPNATVAYNCRPGYRRIPGSRTLTCQEDYTWSTPVPFCTLKSCGNPGEIENGEMHAENFLFGSRVTYTCNEGYHMISKRNYRDCEADSTWSNAPPECEVTICQAPALSSDVSIDPMRDEYSYLDVVRFVCPKPLEIAGNSTAFCTSEGTWSSDAPTCKGVCKNLPFISYAEPAEPLTGNQILEGTSFKFKCKAGYDPVPGISNVLTCLGSRWSSYERFCTPKVCGNPGPIENGYISTGTFYFGSSVTYACLSGYKIKESTSRTCQADGKWSLPIPECKETSFTPQKKQYHYNDLVQFNCSEGYRFTGKSESRCNDQGAWVPDPPTCKGFCYAPPELEFAMLSNSHIKEIFFIGDKVGYKCSQGYTRDYQYENSLTCLGSLKWSDPQQFCSRISCGPPKEIPNGVYEAKDFLFGSEAVYTCSKGYKLKTQIISRKCQANGQWSVPAPACEVHRCQPPEDLENGSYSNKQVVYNYLDSVTYWCNNLTLVGEASISCTEKRNWTSGAPECKPVCKLPSQLQYGELEQNPQKEYFEIGTVLKYKCRPGYVAIENKSNQVICHEDLKWSEPEVFCKRLSCGNPGEIPHGKIHFSDFLFESRVNYTCNEGYNMISRYDFRYCQADGTWNGTSPVCKESICDKIWELQEEARKCTSTPDEWIKYLQVQHLYLQIENLKLDIEIKKKKLSDESTTELIGETR